MEFNERLQELRRQKGLTQEELAQFLYVSRTAISKWESGRGYPNVDSLKAIAKFFGVTIDELLSSDELLTLAEEDTKQKEKYFCDLIFGLLDLSVAMLLFLPFFGEKANGSAQELSLLALDKIAPYLKASYYFVVLGMIAAAILTLILQNSEQRFWVANKRKMSFFLNSVGAVLFVISLQPYAATFLLVILVIKVLLFIKWR